MKVDVTNYANNQSGVQTANGVKTYGIGGQLISPQSEISRPGNGSCDKAILDRVVRHVAPSC